MLVAEDVIEVVAVDVAVVETVPCRVVAVDVCVVVSVV